MYTPWIITAVTVVAVYFLDRWENRYIKSLFDWVPAILLAYVIPALFSLVLQKDFSGAAIHDYSKDFFIPLAIISVMSSLSFRQLKSVGIKPIVVFVAGSMFIALFPVLAVYGFSSSDWVNTTLVAKQYWMGIPPVVGGWIGGSTSQLVLKELVNCPENIFLTILVMDNILVNIWTILMFQGIKRSHQLNSWFAISDTKMPDELDLKKEKTLSPVLTLLIFIALVGVFHFLVDTFVIKVVLFSLLGLALSNFIKSWNNTFSLKVGSILIILVMAVLGLKLQFATFGFNWAFFGFLIVWLVGHFVFTVGVAKVLNVNMAWVPIASMANVGGIATAPAVTAAYNKKWMPHAIVLAILSMATGTFWGMLTIYLLGIMI
ncbi:DUF819 family protein [Allomuricauda sp. d1]|uniref:DUF819 family protein n=1 Tax=Allomuricauda sp. d1 TaxID=3136725 RepID=UPI0031D74DE5